MGKIKSNRKDDIVVATEDVLHLSRLGVDHMAGAIIAAGEAAFATAIEGYVGQRQDVRVVALVQIELLLHRLSEFLLQLFQSLFQSTKGVL